MADLEALRRRLDTVDQSHLLRFYDELAPDRRAALLGQIATIDLASVPRWVDAYVLSAPKANSLKGIEPADSYPFDHASPRRPWDRDRYRAVGEQLFRDGKVAAFTVAGGQGTRLGYEGPKGCFPATPIERKPLFRVFAESLAAARKRFGRPVPWYVMTSPLNHDATTEFFRENRFFGLDMDDVMFFQQGVMPSFDLRSGKILLARKDEVATNPDGHGGAIKALKVSGALGDMAERGVSQISYFQVDNPAARVVDPAFLGLHTAADDSSGEMSSKMVPKVAPEERVGVFCVLGGKVRVVEYSDLPPELTIARDERGNLRFSAGSIAIHAISVEFAERLASNPAFELPFHRAVKKVPFVDIETGRPVEPAEPNGVKLERFIFDALPLCRSSIVVETDRVEEFAPIKNAEGSDSARTSGELQTLRAARWLERFGVAIPRKLDGSPDCTIEVSAETALFPEDLARIAPGLSIKPGERLSL